MSNKTSENLLAAAAAGLVAAFIARAVIRSQAGAAVSSAKPNARAESANEQPTATAGSMMSPTGTGTTMGTTDLSPRELNRNGGAEDPWSISEGERGFKFDASVRPLAAGMCIQTLLLMEVPRLQTLHPEGDYAMPNTRRDLAHSPTPRHGSEQQAPNSGQKRRGSLVGYFNIVDDSQVVIADIVRKDSLRPESRVFIRAGPRAVTYFLPTRVRAAIVTCGGLCPGMNNVVRELVETLLLTYGCERVYGVRNGYWGFHTPDADPAGHAAGTQGMAREEPLDLTAESVAGIQGRGGTVLGSDRGGHDVDVILRFCGNRGINQLYIIGGDGTHRGAHAVHSAAVARGLPLAVAAIPKTIDNDVDVIDRSFGFDTAVEEAQRAIRTAKVEASGAVNGIGLVKLMGRFAGFISAHATMASGDVDLCLIPEIPLVTTGPASFLDHILRVVQLKGHAVVVVAEGAGEALLAAETPVAVDAGGNRKLPPVGPWLTKKITEFLTERGHRPALKYIDPSYMIRSVAANAADAVYCTTLAQASVHGAMAGYTGFSTGLVNNRLVYLPITLVTANSPRKMNARGRTYERMLQLTRQPDPLAYAAYYGLPASKTGGGN